MNRPLEHQLAQQMRDTYLATLSSRLWLMPSAHREEILREVSGHIDLLVAEGQCDGGSPVAAMQRALRQFGQPDPVGRRFATQWRQDCLMKSPLFRAASFSVLALLGQFGVLLLRIIQTYRTSSRSGLDFFLVGSDGTHTEVRNGVSHLVVDGIHIIGINPFYMCIALALAQLLLMVVLLTAGTVYLRRRARLVIC